MAAKKSRSGTRWTEADYAAHDLTQFKTRVSTATKALLIELAGPRGVGALITRLAEEERDRRARRKAP